MQQSGNNTFFTQLVSRGPENVSYTDWEKAYGSFRNWEYASRRQKSGDFSTLILLGLSVLSSNSKWQETVEFTAWVLDQTLLKENGHLEPTVHYFTALALLSMARNEAALDYYLSKAKCMMMSRKSRTQAFHFGVILVNEIRPHEASSTAVPNYVLQFAREMFNVRYPKRKLPRPLLTTEQHSNPTWHDVHIALISAK